MKNNLHKCKSIYCINVKVLFENVRVRVRVRVRPYPPFPTTLHGCAYGMQLHYVCLMAISRGGSRVWKEGGTLQKKFEEQKKKKGHNNNS